MRRLALILVSLVIVVLTGSNAIATQPPRPGTEGNGLGIATNKIDLTRFTYRRALMPLMDAIRENRRLAAGIDSTAHSNTTPLGPTVISGSRPVPVFLVKYKDSGVDPFPPSRLETELFSDEWPVGCTVTHNCTGTMKQYYEEISYGQFSVTGTVNPWTKLPKDGKFYQGDDFADANGQAQLCNGICNTNHVADLIRETVKAHPEIHWEDYDNDGPDGVPNSDDDDGFVDFVAFVHPESGGECNDGNRSIWSHRFNLTSLDGSDIATSRIGHKGTPIRIDDYVIMPALACDRTTMIQIGVFA